ncbi:hypothetical protein AAZX31_05G149500 [Glycine max]
MLISGISKWTWRSFTFMRHGDQNDRKIANNQRFSETIGQHFQFHLVSCSK